MAPTRREVTLEEVLQLVQHLSPRDKVRLIERIAPEIEHALATGQSAPGKALLGLVKDLGPAPSAEEIDAARRDAWVRFPRPES